MAPHGRKGLILRDFYRRIGHASPAKEGCPPPTAMHDAPTDFNPQKRTLTGDTFK